MWTPPKKELSKANIIREAVELMQEFNLAELEIEEKGLKLRLRAREEGGTHLLVSQPGGTHPTLEQESYKNNEKDSTQQPKVEGNDNIFIKSPMIGTFYRSPSPDSDSFVEKGSTVSPNTVVCIIEAMKVMNEIHAETEGKIVEVLVENGESVDFGRPLFRLSPNHE